MLTAGIMNIKSRFDAPDRKEALNILAGRFYNEWAAWKQQMREDAVRSKIRNRQR
jgi:hypothetical protein